MFKVFTFSLLGFTLTACYQGACPAVFITYNLYIVNSQRQPILLDEIMVQNLDNGTVYPACNEVHPYPCLALNPTLASPKYVIMHDGFKGQLSSRGSNIRVSGTKGEQYMQEDYIFRKTLCGVSHDKGSLTIQLD